MPVSATSSGTTFRFVGGTPVPTSTSPGPIFGERAQTLGRGRLLVGLNRSQMHFSSLRGASLQNLELNFTHQNVDFAGCDSTTGGDCSKMGIPTLENDVIQFRLDLDLDVTVHSLLVTYGVSDRVDVGLVLPVVSTRLQGASAAQVMPFGADQVAHYFSGTQASPGLTAQRAVFGDATGVGDVSVRMKVNVSRSEPVSVAVLADARFPTGSADDLLGAGWFAARGLGVISARFGAFAPHINVGYAYRAGDQLNDAVLATVGFEQVLAPWVAQSLDLVSELQVGRSRLVVPGPVVIEAPFRRTVQPTSIPDRRDDIVNASLGFKFSPVRRLTAVANALWPLNRGGLRPNVVLTGGVEVNF